MTLIASALGILYCVSEIALALFKRAKAGDARAADRGSLRLLWVVIMVSVFTGFSMSYRFPRLEFAPQALYSGLGVVLFVVGQALRWYSIVYLGRFFTVNVAIANDHRLIDRGPYAAIRHPSYAGALLAFVGLGLALCNGASLAIIVVPTFLVFAWRIRVEEAALTTGLGDPYRRYVQRTKRLIPGVY